MAPFWLEEAGEAGNHALSEIFENRGSSVSKTWPFRLALQAARLRHLPMSELWPTLSVLGAEAIACGLSRSMLRAQDLLSADQATIFWRRNARRYDRVTLALNRRFAEMAAMVADDVRGSRRVLEVAAGTGLVTVPIARAAGQVVATDRSPEMLQILRSRLHQEGLSNVEVRSADATKLDFPEKTFDAVVAANLLHLLPEPGWALQEFRRVLRPGGPLCVPTFGHGQTTLAGLTSRLLGLAGFRVTSRFSAGSLRLLLESQGFTMARDAVVPGVLPLLYACAR